MEGSRACFFCRPGPRFTVSAMEFDKTFEPARIEERWYTHWLTLGVFTARVDSSRPPFSMVIPPPNITGRLHMGHALNNTLQDILARYRRMRGDDVLWLPGTDHAGIATQMVVDRQLAKEGTSREAVGRGAFVRSVWQCKEERGGALIAPLQRLGGALASDPPRVPTGPAA